MRVLLQSLLDIRKVAPLTGTGTEGRAEFLLAAPPLLCRKDGAGCGEGGAGAEARRARGAVRVGLGQKNGGRGVL